MKAGRTFVGALMATLVLVGSAMAGPLEDAKAAMLNGNPSDLRLLAERGNVGAQWSLGLMYRDGFDYPVKTDHAEAQKWITLAAQNGHVIAQWTLGNMYRWGFNEFPEDKAEAAKWLRFAASQGDTRAQADLGDMAFRTNEKVDKVEGYRWYRLAADHGDVYAQTSLGEMLLRGDGVNRDSAKALEWFRKAADRAFAGAQGWLGIMYFHGLGVRQNYVQAHMWFNLAAAHPLDLRSDKKARETAINNLQFVTSKMTPEQIAEAQKLASEWTPKQ